MKPIRELMKDKRVAAGLAGIALLFVVYRVTQTGKPPVAQGVADNGASAAAPAAPGAGENGAMAASGAFALSPVENAAASSVPKGDVAWNWERNPFIGPPKRQGLAVGGDEFPTVIVPGFGVKEKATAPPSGAAPVPGLRTGDPELSATVDALPELRGTVLSGGRGIAIFGNRLVPSGEQVAGWTVDRVTAYDVSIRKGKERRTIEMFKPGRGEDKGGNP